MSHWLSMFEDSLKSSGIFSDYHKKMLVPTQIICENITDFMQNFLQLSHRFPVKNIVFLSDGCPKKIKGSSLTVDESIKIACNSENITYSWLDLSEILQLPPQAIHASQKNVITLSSIVKQNKNSIFVVVGSGTITDIVKQALFIENMQEPLVSVPTALTVTAYTSNFSVLEYDGVKRTKISRHINANIWIKSIISEAPCAMSRAGYGDLLACFVAYADWYLAYSLGMADNYNETGYKLMLPFLDMIKNSARAFNEPSLPSNVLDGMCIALAMAGVVMSVSNETTPLSGFEHAWSHAIDYLKYSSGRDLILHGEQVALGCLISSSCYDWLLNQTTLNTDKMLNITCKEHEQIISKLLHEAPYFPNNPQFLSEEKNLTKCKSLSEASNEFTREYLDKCHKWQEVKKDNFNTFIENWPQCKKHLSELTIPAKEIKKLLTLAGLPFHPIQTNPPLTKVEFYWAIKFSPYVRKRLAICDLLLWLGHDLSSFINIT